MKITIRNKMRSKIEEYPLLESLRRKRETAR
jgi:hypothetical protein